MIPTPVTYSGAMLGSSPGFNLPQAERLSLQNEASNLVNLIAQAHERLDRLTGVGQTPATPNAALPPVSVSINMATGDASRLIQRLEELCEHVGQI